MRLALNNSFHDLHAAVLFDVSTEKSIGIGIRPDFDASAAGFVSELCRNWREGQALLEIDLENETLAVRCSEEEVGQFLFDLNGTPDLAELKLALSQPKNTKLGRDSQFCLSQYTCFVPSEFDGEFLEIELRAISCDERTKA